MFYNFVSLSSIRSWLDVFECGFTRLGDLLTLIGEVKVCFFLNKVNNEEFALLPLTLIN